MSIVKKAPVCQICGRNHHADLRPGVLVRPVVGALILRKTGQWSEEGWICVTDLEKFQLEYVRELLEEDRGELSEIDEQVVQSLQQQEILARNPDEGPTGALTAGQRLADRIAALGGSWGFIGIFMGILLLWIAVNSTALLIKPFDPFPYILLNLMLSCIAAIQAPIIMMSQNRQEARDRLHAQHDYQVNLKAELEIRQLHQKIDHMLSHQWQRLVEIQEIQMELIAELRARKL
ncbi:MAG TPA: DUF1003 domain-containing protein [bacterium]|nr:DUF1003 domain-containing protein [bacterium]HPR87316.1 DUF1003 domain-containing protein [bacterium]